MNAQKIAQRLYESFTSDDLCEHPEIVDAVEDLADEYEDLKTENAKLRELAKDACTVLRGFFDHEWFDDTVFAERMHDLGIEVD